MAHFFKGLIYKNVENDIYHALLPYNHALFCVALLHKILLRDWSGFNRIRCQKVQRCRTTPSRHDILQLKYASFCLYIFFSFISLHWTSDPHVFYFDLTGELFAQAPVEEYPGNAVETVSDSSRYFVLRIQDDNGE